MSLLLCWWVVAWGLCFGTLGARDLGWDYAIRKLLVLRDAGCFVNVLWVGFSVVFVCTCLLSGLVVVGFAYFLGFCLVLDVRGLLC